MRNLSLTLVVTILTAAAIAASMALYAVVQYFLYPGISVWELVLRHLWHVVVLGAVIYGFCWIGFQQTIIEPVNKIYMHLYKIGEGHLERLEMNTRIKELCTIVDGINAMVWHIEQDAAGKALMHADRKVEDIARLAAGLASEGNETLLTLKREVAELHATLRSAAGLQMPAHRQE